MSSRKGDTTVRIKIYMGHDFMIDLNLDKVVLQLNAFGGSRSSV